MPPKKTKIKGKPAKIRQHTSGRADMNAIYGSPYRKGKAKKVGKKIGGFLGSKFGAPGRSIGRALGGLGGDLFSKITGIGDYHIQSNSLLSSASDGVPIMHNNKGTVRVQHVEFIGNIVSTQAFNNTTYIIQPTNHNTFPWLSGIAANFEQWQAHGMVFFFKSMSSDTQIASTVSLGQILMATDYNALSEPFINETQMLNSQFSCSTKPSQHVTHYIECAPGHTPVQPMYCYNTTDLINGDLRLYNLGNFQLATQGMQAPDDQVLGQLFISYDIELFKPILSPTTDLLLPYSFNYQSSGDCSSSAPYGVDVSTYSQSYAGLTQTLDVGIANPAMGFRFTLLDPEDTKNWLLVYRWRYPTSLSLNATYFDAVDLVNITLDPAYGPNNYSSASDTVGFTIIVYCVITDPTLPFGIQPRQGSGFVFTGSASLGVTATPYNRSV